MDKDLGEKINDNEKKAHILAIPLPVQGHINPILQFSKRLASKGLKITLIIASNDDKLFPTATSGSISISHIVKGDESDDDKLTAIERVERFRTVVSRNLAEFVKSQVESDFPPSVLVYDSIMPWALDIAIEHGLQGAPFFIQPCMVDAIYYLVHQGRLEFPVRDPISDLIPSMPVLEPTDLPSMVVDTQTHPGLISFVLSQFSNLERAKWIFGNTFSELEDEVLKWIRTQYPFMPIGPSIPSMYLDQRLKDDKEYGLSLFKPEIEPCMKWLDSKEPNSVIYVSFGSIATLGQDQMDELAWGLKNSNINFLWVVRESETNKLPPDFLDEIRSSGTWMIVAWCSQLEVLAHRAVGCFLSHCGWSSTLEALSLGVPLVAMAQWTDQPMIAKYIEDVWKVGLRARLDIHEKRIASREHIEACVREVMEGGKGKEIRRNSLKWREIAKKAVDEGGSSDRNINDFVSELI